MSDAKVFLIPTNEAIINHHKSSSLLESIVNQVNGTRIVNHYVAGENSIQPHVENPFLIGGRMEREYEVTYLRKNYKIKAKTPFDAVKIFYEKKCYGKDVELIAKKVSKRDCQLNHYKIKIEKGKVVVKKIKNNS